MDWSADLLKFNPVIPVLTFVLGFLTSRFTLTKKERKDVEQKQFETTKSLMESQNDRFQEFAGALAKYNAKTDDPTLDDFFVIATIGQKYFDQQIVTSEAILADKVDPALRNNSLIPKLVETVERILPAYYRTLRNIAERKGIRYDGVLDRKNYESLYLVVETYGKHLSAR
jgi:hypothetical protein